MRSLGRSFFKKKKHQEPQSQKKELLPATLSYLCFIFVRPHLAREAMFTTKQNALSRAISENKEKAIFREKLELKLAQRPYQAMLVDPLYHLISYFYFKPLSVNNVKWCHLQFRVPYFSYCTEDSLIYLPHLRMYVSQLGIHIHMHAIYLSSS